MKHESDITSNQRAIALLIGPRYRFFRHLILLLALLLFLYSSGATRGGSAEIRAGRLMSIYIGFIIMLYTNMYLLVPLFFFRGKYLHYFGMLAATVYLVLLLISLVLDNYFLRTTSNADCILEDEEQLGLYTGGLICIAIILVTTAFKLFGRWIADREKMAEMNNIALKLELDGLRNQINPHFLFNMLNNVKALIRIDPEKASSVIMKLSEFLRYQLYDNKGPAGSLQSELDFLFNLVELEKIRRDNLEISILVDIASEDICRINLPPNLFTNFVENAIKYSVDLSGNPEKIWISLSVQAHMLNFSCSNTKGPDIWNDDLNRGGLGLSNTKRRLELLYPGSHALECNSSEDLYNVDLKIPI